ncbi:MAG: glycosyltransferase [Pelotomaculum sp.]|nr:glycosyltransferase [Pelotomaculum sp.]
MFSIIAPAYNEEEVIADFVHSVMRELSGARFELVVVNDGSTDATGTILKQLQRVYANLAVVEHESNRGLGAGLISGFKTAKGDVIVTMDADLSHDPSYIIPMIKKVRLGYDIVIASRYVTGGGMEGVPARRQWISRLANAFIRRTAGWKVRDASSGFRAYRAGLVKNLKNLDAGFSIQVEILRELLKQSARVYEQPFILRNRRAGRSKMKYINLIPGYAKLLLSLR